MRKLTELGNLDMVVLRWPWFLVLCLVVSFLEVRRFVVGS